MNVGVGHYSARVDRLGKNETSVYGGRRFTCRGCRRFVLFEHGAADDMGDACDDCWYETHHPREVA